MRRLRRVLLFVYPCSRCPQTQWSCQVQVCQNVCSSSAAAADRNLLSSDETHKHISRSTHRWHHNDDFTQYLSMMMFMTSPWSHQTQTLCVALSPSLSPQQWPVSDARSGISPTAGLNNITPQSHTAHTCTHRTTKHVLVSTNSTHFCCEQRICLRGRLLTFWSRPFRSRCPPWGTSWLKCQETPTSPVETKRSQEPAPSTSKHPRIPNV